MPSLCCFWCPAADKRERKPGEKCPTCGRAYETPLTSRPEQVSNYTVTSSIARGFYGATYRALQKSLGRTVVLKVVPVGLYKAFNKDWAAECQVHAEIAEHTRSVAGIQDQFEARVAFGDDELDCYVAVLENIQGPTLEMLLEAPSQHGLTARAACQIAADLFAVFDVFSKHERFHNDLHGGNILIRQLGPNSPREGALDSTVQAVAIDLGSIKEKSLSDGTERLGDQQQIATHVASLADAVRSLGSSGSDIDHRLAGALRGLAEHMAGGFGATRVMTVDDAREALRVAINATDEPWRLPLRLHRFGDTYNAQALESWHVPRLWFDPDGRWLKTTTVKGPLVITGMRGCGKTMLLRALHFHARAVAHGDERNLEGLQAEDFVGIYASCMKLLDPRGGVRRNDEPVLKPFERIFVAYLRDAVQVLKHLRSLDRNSVPGSIHTILGPAVTLLSVPIDLALPQTESAFDRFLVELQFGLADGTLDYSLRAAPTEVFGRLAELLRGASSTLAGKNVLFLLDDVSTRYLSPQMVATVISTLLFQHPSCAFRITTEAQALQRVLLSPGGAALADPSRDYQEFDLGKEVYSLLKTGSLTERTEFVSEILRRRGRQFADSLYQREPKEVLGDVALSEIAREIATSTATSAARKRVYRGLRALQAVCVGDLGDIVKLYEKILDRAKAASLPVSAEAQCDCFLDHSAGLMHFLNRRDQKKKNLALAFAEASGELLKQSLNAEMGAGAHGLRQYTKLYVRVDSKSDYEAVADELFGLLDAGVFVYDGGRARTKTRDSDPVLQFKLTFRKLLGLASFIGLSSRDRFELSGDKLRKWLLEPDAAKQILLESESRKAGRVSENGDAEPDEEPVADATSVGVPAPIKRPPSLQQVGQMALDLTGQRSDESKTADSTSAAAPPRLGLSVANRTLDDWRGCDVGTVVIGRGFEARTAESARRLLSAVSPRRIALVEYEGAQGADVEATVATAGVPVARIRDPGELTPLLTDEAALTVVDATGLSKPFLFVALRDALKVHGRVGVVHTLAEDYYPRNEDLEALGITAGDSEPREVIGRLGGVLMGEQGPYSLRKVHETVAEPERWRTLLASASPKNDRLLHLLDTRDYDAVRILVPQATSPRGRVARAAAQLAASAAGANVGLVNVDSNDLQAALSAFETIYSDHYYVTVSIRTPWKAVA